MVIRTDVLLVGGGVASVRCARTLRREGFAGSILLVGEEPIPPYNRPPLSKELLRDDLPDELVAAEPERWYERRKVELRTALHVESLDPEAGRAALADGTQIEFERCLLAPGAAPRALRVPGAEHVLLLRTLGDARRLRSAAEAAPSGASVVGVGGGFIGVEVASSLAALGLRPTIVELGERLWSGSLGERLESWALEQLREAGVEVRTGAAVTRVEADAAWIGDERLPAAFVVAGIGVEPRVRLAAEAGLAVDDGIVTDERQRTSHPSLWAAGDAARSDGQRVEHWHAARESGERAALSMLGLPVPSIPAPWLFTEVAGTTVDVIGVAEGWTAERPLLDNRVVVMLDGTRVVMLAIVDSAVPVEQARELVAAGASVQEIERAAAPTAGGAG